MRSVEAILEKLKKDERQYLLQHGNESGMVSLTTTMDGTTP
jgi:hypothetical protein